MGYRCVRGRGRRYVSDFLPDGYYLRSLISV